MQSAVEAGQRVMSAAVLLLVWRTCTISAQEGTENLGPAVGANILETQPAYGIVVYIPPVQRHYVYPGPLPLPGISWPIVGSAGIGYRAEGRFPYSGYVGNTAPYLKNVLGIPTPSPNTPVELWKLEGEIQRG